MKTLLVLAAVCVATSLATALFDPMLDDYWDVYKTVHRKQYGSTSEERVRRLVWEKNVEYIRRHNLEADLGIHKHRLGVNEHADMTDEEYSKYLTGYVMKNMTSAPQYMQLANAQVPDTMDWREQGYVTPVKNQARCGSCWAFSATGSLEGQHFKKTKKLVSLSEQNLVDCSQKEGNHGCQGGSMDAAFMYIAKNGGIDTEESYPYKAKNGKCHFEKEDVGAKDQKFQNIPRFDEMALKEAVATVGPISVAIDASKKDFRFYKTGVYTSMECSNMKLDHGVLVVGYGMEMEDDYWLVKNSWGTTWGDHGYIKMRRNHHNMCGIATMASYPTGVM